MQVMLSGGGDAEQSAPIDKFFAKKTTKQSMLFLPQAVVPNIWNLDELEEWIEKHAPFEDLKINIETDLEQIENENLRNYGSVYLMGGSTVRLLSQLKKSGLLEPLRDFIMEDNPVYGLSAGAIIMGKDITTTTLGPEGEDGIPEEVDADGLNLLNGWNIYCHYSPEHSEELQKYISSSDDNLLAIPETSGVWIGKNTLRIIGEDPVVQFQENIQHKFSPNEELEIGDVFPE